MPKGLTLRKVQKTGNSLTVALPPAAVRVLRARAGRPVQVLVGRRGTVVIAPVSRRIGVKQEFVDLVAQLRAAQSENTRLRAKLGGRPLRIFREGHAQGFLQASTARFLDLDVLLNLLRRLLAGVEAQSPEQDPGRDLSPAVASSEARAPTA